MYSIMSLGVQAEQQAWECNLCLPPSTAMKGAQKLVESSQAASA